MSFYLKPPRGHINCHKLEECVKQRITCYDNLCNNNTEEVSSFDCLIEDSPLDRTGHYLFRLLAYSSPSFREVFIRNEQKLLLSRLNCYDKKDARYFLKTLARQSKDIIDKNEEDEKVLEVCAGLCKICYQILKKDYIFDKYNYECEEVTLSVPFHLCASLIYNRDVNLSRGFAIVSCEDWKKLLSSLFNTYLRRALEVMRYSRSVEAALFDDRIKGALEIVNHWFRDGSISKESKFDVRQIKVESKFFPLCMLNLYKVLEKTNRLAHNDRFEFSLYMKGIGVSLADSVKFWETAYSKQHASCSKCTHDWGKNEKRYIYGIRHLYGLEGSRKNYQVKSCHYLQEKSLCANEDGGCPFKHFDDDNLRKVLKKLLPKKEDDVEVMIYERRDSPSEACKLFYETVFKEVIDKDVGSYASFRNPVEYYLSLKSGVKSHS